VSTPSTEALLDLIQSARGERPYSLGNQETEQVLNIVLALVIELSVSNDRIDRIERLLAEARGVSLDDLRAAPLGDAAQAERDDATTALMMRALRVVIDPRTATDGRDAAIAALKD
jgi:hypothetical protein